MEFETAEFGQISNEEGYWVMLRRLSPYGSVYPSRFVNPKQK
jgi:O-glycosyl hydrolase